MREQAVRVAATEVELSALLDNAGSAHAQISVTAELLDPSRAVLSSTEERLTLQGAQRRRVQLKLKRPPPGAYAVRLTVATAERTWFQEELPITVAPTAQ